MNINFEGKLSGDTATALRRAAEAAGVDVYALLSEVLATALADRLSPRPVKRNEVKACPHVINEGGGGIHVYTVVNDGYGYLVAEDSQGTEQARVRATEHGASMDPTDDLATLAKRWVAALENADR